jgi:hypothetical protein
MLRSVKSSLATKIAGERILQPHSGWLQPVTYESWRHLLWPALENSRRPGGWQNNWRKNFRRTPFSMAIGCLLYVHPSNLGKSAVELLRAASPYELGEPPPIGGTLYPVFVRGQAKLLLHQGSEARADFQKLLDHWASYKTSPWVHLPTSGSLAPTQ